MDLNELLADPQSKAALKQWKRLLGHETADMQSMAIEQLHRAGLLSGEQLLTIFKTTPYAIVRIQALTSLADVRDDNFVEAIRLGVSDSYELVQRFALRYLSQSGEPRLIPALIGVCIYNNTSERCNFNAMNALSVYPEADLMDAFAEQFDNPAVHYIDKPTIREQIVHAIEVSARKWLDNLDQVLSADTPKPTRKLSIRTTRNYCPYYRIPEMMECIRQSDDDEIKVMLMESLGWRRQCYLYKDIMDFALTLSNDTTQSAVVRQEALKTYNRLR